MNAQEKSPGTERGVKEKFAEAVAELDRLYGEVGDVLAPEFVDSYENGKGAIKLLYDMTEIAVLEFDPVVEQLRKFAESDAPLPTILLTEFFEKMRDRLFDLAGMVLDERKRSERYGVPLLPFVEQIADTVCDKLVCQYVKVLRLMEKLPHSPD